MSTVFPVKIKSVSFSQLNAETKVKITLQHQEESGQLEHYVPSVSKTQSSFVLFSFSF